jgi:ankyrin repeat protein
LMLAVINGHVDVVRTLVRAGANLAVRGTGAPGFADKTAMDLAVARGGQEMVDVLSARGPASDDIR